MAPATATSAQGGMFHTFQGVTPRKPASEQQQENPKSSSASAAKRITTPHACAECKRRKMSVAGFLDHDIPVPQTDPSLPVDVMANNLVANVYPAVPLSAASTTSIANA